MCSVTCRYLHTSVTDTVHTCRCAPLHAGICTHQWQTQYTPVDVLHYGVQWNAMSDKWFFLLLDQNPIYNIKQYKSQTLTTHFHYFHQIFLLRFNVVQASDSQSRDSGCGRRGRAKICSFTRLEAFWRQMSAKHHHQHLLVLYSSTTYGLLIRLIT